MEDGVFNHIPVMPREVTLWMDPKPNGVYLDGTIGGGGHSREILVASGGTATLYGLDRDPAAIAAASAKLAVFPNFHVIHGNFHQSKALLRQAGLSAVNGALLDLGVSSHQLDTPVRGFSYHEDAPLDMRMDPTRGETAAEYLATVSVEEFCRVLREYGEERWAARIAAVLAERRVVRPILTTGDLVGLVDAAIPRAVRRREDGHPARRTFQALRIALNDELDPLDAALCDLADCMALGGRLLVITFHSLEDRIVKNVFRRFQNPCVCPAKSPLCTCGRKPVGRILAGGPVCPSAEEVARNPRARTAKLRVFERR